MKLNGWLVRGRISVRKKPVMAMENTRTAIVRDFAVKQLVLMHTPPSRNRGEAREVERGKAGCGTFLCHLDGAEVRLERAVVKVVVGRLRCARVRLWCRGGGHYTRVRFGEGGGVSSEVTRESAGACGRRRGLPARRAAAVRG